MNAKIKKYVRERDEMLKKRDIAALEQFIRSHEEFFGKGFAARFADTSEGYKRCMLHKMIANAVNLPQDMRAESARWLVYHGFTID